MQEIEATRDAAEQGDLITYDDVYDDVLKMNEGKFKSAVLEHLPNPANLPSRSHSVPAPLRFRQRGNTVLGYAENGKDVIQEYIG